MTLAADETHLFFASHGGGRLERISLGGGTAEALFSIGNSDGVLGRIDSIYLGPDHIVFVVDQQDLASYQLTRTLFAQPKDGGTAIQLAMSSDPRAFLGATVDGAHVIYSTFTSLLRVPLAGGTVELIGESPSSVRYWVRSPVVVAEQIYWAEADHLYRIDKDETDGQGTLFASLGMDGKIVATGATFVVTMGPGHNSDNPAMGFAEIDAGTGQLGTFMPFDMNVDQATATERDVWGAGVSGLARVPRGGGASERVWSTPTFDVVATPDAVFAGTEAGIARFALP